jgi:hypothetical protein
MLQSRTRQRHPDAERRTTMKRMLATLAVTASTTLAALAAAGPAGADVTNTGCPTGWQLAPTSVLSPSQLATLTDLNHDGLVCIQYPVQNPTALSSEPFGNFFIYIDNDTP